MTKFKINKKMFYLIVIIVLETIIVKILQYIVLPPKYFFDSGAILTHSIDGNFNADKSYNFTAKFFYLINIFNFTTLKEWSYFLASIFTIIICIVIGKNKKIVLRDEIYILASVGLLNIYVFNISKDIIQFFFFFIIFLILKMNKLSNNKKLIISCIILLLEALFFRVYYAIMAMIMMTIYFVYKKIITKEKLNKKGVFKVIMIILVLFFAEVFIVQKISPENYNSIINARYSVNIYRENSTDAATIITDLLGKNTNFLKFVLNYIINLIRMLVPIELVLKGIKYIPFIIYQIYIEYILYKNCRKLTEKNILWFIVSLSYIMVSVIFEPDFGSFIRHESTMFLIYLELSKNLMSENYEKNNDIRNIQ